MKAEQLRTYTRKKLTEMAKRDRIAGRHSMRKEELVKALLASRRSGRSGRRRRNEPKSTNRKPSTNGQARPSVSRGGNGQHPQRSRTHRRDLARQFGVEEKGARDTIEATVQDAYWIHVRWRFRRVSVRRAEAALGMDWHRAEPIVRLLEITTADDGPETVSRWVRDVEIHGDVDHWYIPVDEPGRTYRLQIGYRARDGRFHPLGKSRLLKTPRRGACGTVDRSWKQKTKKGKVPERIRKPQPPSGNGSHADRRGSPVPFQVDAELIVHGTADPDADLTVLGEPVPLSRDGRFSLRFSLPEGRTVIPATTRTRGGTEEQTIALAVERNTKKLAPQPVEELTL